MKRTIRLGRLVATPGALEACAISGENPLRFIVRHAQGDWGDLGADDIRANERAVEDGSRLLSAYHLKTGQKIWIITEAESVEDDPNSRLSTCLLLPEEY